MNAQADNSLRILNSLGLFIFGAVIGFVFVVMGAMAVGAGHGSGLFYLLASSPGIYVLRHLPAAFENPLVPALFWPMVFAALPWVQRKVIFYVIAVSLLLHFVGVVYGMSEDGISSGLGNVFDSMPGMFLFVSLFYIGTHTVIIISLWRAYKKMETPGKSSL